MDSESRCHSRSLCSSTKKKKKALTAKIKRVCLSGRGRGRVSEKREKDQRGETAPCSPLGPHHSEPPHQGLSPQPCVRFEVHLQSRNTAVITRRAGRAAARLK